MSIYFDLLLVTVIVVYIVALSGFTQTWGGSPSSPPATATAPSISSAPSPALSA